MKKSNEKKFLGTVPKKLQFVKTFWDCPEFSRNKQNQKGITLIALIITIIVMLILVGVTINVALNGGLFQKAETAKTQTQLAADKEELQIEIAIAYNEKGRRVDLDLLKTNLGKKNWKDITISGDKLTCTSPKGNVFTVDNKGNIEPGGNGSGGEGQEPGGNGAGIQIINTYNVMNNTEVLRIIPVLYTEKEAAQMVYTDLTGETDNTIEKKEDLILIIANSDNPNPFGTYDDMISAMQSSVDDDISTPEKAFAYMMKQPGIEKDYETLEEYAAAITNSGNKALKIDGTPADGATWEGCIAIYEATENKQYQIQIEIDGKVGTTAANVTNISTDTNRVFAYGTEESFFIVFLDSNEIMAISDGSVSVEKSKYTVYENITDISGNESWTNKDSSLEGYLFLDIEGDDSGAMIAIKSDTDKVAYVLFDYSTNNRIYTNDTWTFEKNSNIDISPYL